MNIQSAPPGLDSSMDYDMIDSVKQGREHPKIKGLVFDILKGNHWVAL